MQNHERQYLETSVRFVVRQLRTAIAGMLRNANSEWVAWALDVRRDVDQLERLLLSDPQRSDGALCSEIALWVAGVNAKLSASIFHRDSKGTQDFCYLSTHRHLSLLRVLLEITDGSPGEASSNLPADTVYKLDEARALLGAYTVFYDMPDAYTVHLATPTHDALLLQSPAGVVATVCTTEGGLCPEQTLADHADLLWVLGQMGAELKRDHRPDLVDAFYPFKFS